VRDLKYENTSMKLTRDFPWLVARGKMETFGINSYSAENTQVNPLIW
jgi:hypothetical protein